MEKLEKCPFQIGNKKRMPAIVTFIQPNKGVIVSKARKRNERVNKVETKLSLFIAVPWFIL